MASINAGPGGLRGQPTVIRSITDVIGYIDSLASLSGRARLAWYLALGGLFFDAFSNSALSVGVGTLRAQLSLTAAQVGTLTAAASFVAMAFNPLGGVLADRFGRILPMILAKVLCVTGAAVAVTAHDFQTVLYARFLVGAAFGLDFSVAMALLAEYTPKRERGKLNVWTAFWALAFVVNFLLALLFYYWNVGQNLWRYSVAATGVFALTLFFLQLFFLVESPTWLARRGRIAAAAKSMTRLYNRPFIADTGSHVVDAAPGGASGLKAFVLLFQGGYLRRTILQAGISFFQTIISFSIGWYLPAIGLMLFGGSFVQATLGAIVFQLFAMAGGFCSPWLGRRIGFRTAAMCGFGIEAVMLLLMGLTYGHTPALVTACFPIVIQFCHYIGPGPSAKSIASLSYRSELRSTGTAFCGVLSQFGGALGLFFFPVLIDALGLRSTLCAVAGVSLLGFLLCLAINWEPTRAKLSADEEEDMPALNKTNSTSVSLEMRS